MLHRDVYEKRKSNVFDHLPDNPNRDCPPPPNKKSPLKTFWEKKKMLDTSFLLSHK